MLHAVDIKSFYPLHSNKGTIFLKSNIDMKLLIRDHSGNITGVEALRGVGTQISPFSVEGVPRFHHSSEGGHPDFNNLPWGEAEGHADSANPHGAPRFCW